MQYVKKSEIVGKAEKINPKSVIYRWNIDKDVEPFESIVHKADDYLKGNNVYNESQKLSMIAVSPSSNKFIIASQTDKMWSINIFVGLRPTTTFKLPKEQTLRITSMILLNDDILA
jgi:hypothetical protein